MSNPQELVKEFHETYGLPIKTDSADVVPERTTLRLDLIIEELVELLQAIYGEDVSLEASASGWSYGPTPENAHDIVEVADALGDLVYVIYGMAIEFGIPLDKVLEEIQRSNMSKLGEDGNPIYRTDGKVMKGPGFFKPDIKRVLGI